jgi:hypothetical protein
MKVARLTLTACLTLASLTALAAPGFSLPDRMLIADRRARETCVEAAQQQGLQVTDVVEQNNYSGGTEVILRGRNRNQTVTVGCDYADNTGQVQLYRLEGRDGRQNDRGNNNRGDREVGSRGDAERIARREIQQQLGVDADSDVIEIDETRNSDRKWYVEGNVNGAPFEVRIRRDGSVENFVLR